MAFPVSRSDTTTTTTTTTPQLSDAQIIGMLGCVKAEEIDRICIKMIGFMFADPEFVKVELSPQDVMHLVKAIEGRPVSKEWLAEAELSLKRSKISHQMLPGITKMLRESLTTDFLNKGVSFILNCDQKDKKRGRHEAAISPDYKICLSLDKDLTRENSELVFSFVEQHLGKKETRCTFPLSAFKSSF